MNTFKKRNPSRWIALRLMVARLLVAVAAGAVVVACTPDLTDAEHVQKAREFQGKGEIQASVIELKNALLKNPKNLEARALLGQAYVEIGDGAAGEKELRQAVDLGMPAHSILRLLAQAQLLQGNYDELLDESSEQIDDLAPAERAELVAIRGHALAALSRFDAAGEAYDSALALEPASREARLGNANLALLRGDADKARKLADELIADAPDFGRAWVLLGDLERLTGNMQKAEEAYTRSIGLHANNYYDFAQRAFVRIQLEDYDGAKADIAAVNKARPGTVEGAYLEGVLQFKQGKFAEAQVALENAVNREGALLDARLYLGAAHFYQEHFQQAEQYLSQYWNQFPGSVSASQMLALTRLREANFDGAEEVAKAVLERRPDDPFFLRVMGHIHLGRGETSEAVSYLSRAFPATPDETAQARALRGVTLLGGGELELGTAELEKALEQDPRFQQAQVTLFLVHLQAREFDEAQKVAQQAAEQFPDAAWPLNLLGMVSMAKGDDASAQTSLELALAKSPGDPSASHNLALLARKSGKLDRVQELYEQVLEHNPAHVSTLVQLTTLHAVQGHPEAARKVLERAVAAAPTALEPRVLLAASFLDDGQPRKALDTLAEVKDQSGDRPSYLRMAGQTQLALGDVALATDSFKKLVRVQPESAEAHYLLAKAYALAGNEQQSSAEIAAALNVDPTNLPARLARMRELAGSGRLDQAMSMMKLLREDFPQHPEVIAQAGWLALQQDRPEEAVATLTEAMKLAPSAELVMSLAGAQLRVRDSSAAEKSLDDWLVEHPDDVAPRYMLANVYLRSGREELAAESLRKVLDQSPDHVAALNDFAWLTRKSEPDKALAHAERALELAPDSPAVLDTAGMLLLEAGQRGRALDLLEKAARQAPENRNTVFHYALALSRSGQEEKAVEVLRKLLSESKGFAERADAEQLLESLGG